MYPANISRGFWATGHLNRLSTIALIWTVSAAPSWGATTIGGDAGEVSPANPAIWNMPFTYIGINPGKTGTVMVDWGSDVTLITGYLGHNSDSTGTATVTGSGSTWTSTFLYIGNAGNGILTIENSGLVTNASYSYLGYETGSIGTAIVTGAGSKWTNGGELYVGRSGNAMLTVENGGWASSSVVYLGYNTISTATATVTGAGSIWTSSGDLYIGRSGSGAVMIEDGGLASSSVAYLGYNAGSTGTATVTGSGSTWTNSDSLFVGHSGNGTLTVENNGQVNSSSLYVGSSGNGTLTVKNGGQVNNSVGYLGYNNGSTGTAKVTGAGSKWSNSGDLYVGSYSNGTLTVENGGLVTAKTLYASLEDLFGNGTIAVDGAVLDEDLVFNTTHGLTNALTFGSGGTLNLNVNGIGILGVGHKGTGTLRIAEGRTVESSGGYLGYNVGSTGTATVTGSGSKWINSSILYVGHSGSGTLRIENGGEITSAGGSLGHDAGSTGTATVTGSGSKWTNSSDLYIGSSGNGTLIVENGGQVSNTTGYLGYNTGTTGTVTVTGSGSTWTNNGDLYVGRYGSGTLSVQNGGLVTAQTLYASPNDLYGNGTISVTGAFLDANLVFDSSTGPSANATFGSGGTLILNLDGSGELAVGHYGTGTMLVTEGQTIASTGSYLGYNTGSTGMATVTGAGSEWNNSSSLYVGRYGSGELTVDHGGQVSNTTGYLGYYSGSTGMVTVTGADSKWINSSGLYVGYGYSSSGALRIENGGQVTSTTGYLGLYTSSRGTATVTGSGSTWTISNGLSIRNGTLRIENGGQVTSTGGNLGFNTGSTGTVTVTGTGSKWSNSSSLYIGGFSGSGILTVENGGQVIFDRVILGYGSGSTGTATVTGMGSKWINSSDLYVGNYGTGTLTVADGGQVTTKALFVNTSQSSINLRVSGNDMIVLGTANTAGSVANHGKINILANAFLSAGTYTPITEYAGRAMSWSGTGTYHATGGTWNNTAKTFTVTAATELASGATELVTTGQRLTFTDSATGQRVGASFGTVTPGTTFAASLMDSSQRSGIPLWDGQSVLSAWNFASNIFNGSVLLAFDIGQGASDLKVQRYVGSTWSTFAANDLIYDSHGIVSFTVSGFSGYAITGTISEPVTPGLLGDTNGDNVVDVTDFNNIQNNFGATGPGVLGDTNNDGVVDVTDYNNVQNNFGAMASTSMEMNSGVGSVVPEPTSLGLLTIGGLMMLARRRRNCK